MIKKVLGTIGLCLITSTSWAYRVDEIPNSNQDRVKQVEKAINILETKTGQTLSDQQVELIISSSFKDNPSNYVEVAALEPMTAPKKKNIYCLGFSLSGGTKYSGAACVHIWSLKTYDLHILGVGMVFEIEGHILRASVTYDSDRYDENFDPIPGEYGGISLGGTLGLGYEILEADSGNKSITIRGLNIGIGIDYPSINYIRIY